MSTTHIGQVACYEESGSSSARRLQVVIDVQAGLDILRSLGAGAAPTDVPAQVGLLGWRPHLDWGRGSGVIRLIHNGEHHRGKNLRFGIENVARRDPRLVLTVPWAWSSPYTLDLFGRSKTLVTVDSVGGRIVVEAHIPDAGDRVAGLARRPRGEEAARPPAREAEKVEAAEVQGQIDSRYDTAMQWVASVTTPRQPAVLADPPSTVQCTILGQFCDIPLQEAGALLARYGRR